MAHRASKQHQASSNHGHKAGATPAGSHTKAQEDENNHKFSIPQIHSNLSVSALEVIIFSVVISFNVAQLIAMYGKVDFYRNYKIIAITALCCGNQFGLGIFLKRNITRMLNLAASSIEGTLITSVILNTMLFLTYSRRYTVFSTRGLWALQFLILNKGLIVDLALLDGKLGYFLEGKYAVISSLLEIALLTYTSTVYPLLVTYHPRQQILYQQMDTLIIFLLCLITLSYVILFKFYISKRLSVLLFVRRHPNSFLSKLIAPLVEFDVTSLSSSFRSTKSSSSFAVQMLSLLLLVLVCIESTLALFNFRQRIAASLLLVALASLILILAVVAHFTLNTEQLNTVYPNLQKLQSKVDGSIITKKIELLTKCQSCLQDLKVEVIPLSCSVDSLDSSANKISKGKNSAGSDAQSPQSPFLSATQKSKSESHKIAAEQDKDVKNAAGSHGSKSLSKIRSFKH